MATTREMVERDWMDAALVLRRLTELVPDCEVCLCRSSDGSRFLLSIDDGRGRTLTEHAELGWIDTADGRETLAIWVEDCWRRGISDQRP